MWEDLIRKIKKEHAFWPSNDAASRTHFYDSLSENFHAELIQGWKFSFWLLFSKCFCVEKSAPWSVNTIFFKAQMVRDLCSGFTNVTPVSACIMKLVSNEKDCKIPKETALLSIHIHSEFNGNQKGLRLRSYALENAISFFLKKGFFFAIYRYVCSGKFQELCNTE